MTFILSENRDMLQQAHKLDTFFLPLLVPHQNNPEKLFRFKYFMTIAYFLFFCKQTARDMQKHNESAS